MIIIDWLVLLVPMFAGVAAVAAARVLHEKMLVVACGSLVGLAFFTTVTYVVSAVTGLTVALLCVMLGAHLLAGLAILYRTSAWREWRSLPLDRTGLLFIAVVCVPIFFLVSKLLLESSGGLVTGILNAWGDLGWHMSNITNFAQGQTVPPQNPIFAGHRLTYPFLSNVLSALLLLAGASYPSSVITPALVLIPISFILLYGLTLQVTKQRGAAVLVVLLFMCAGGTLGWLRLFPDFATAQTTFTDFFTHLPRDYTGSGGDGEGYNFLNPLLSLFLPQRSFLFGIPMALGILLLLARARTSPHEYMLAGLLAGLLPMFHGHTVLSLVPPIVALFGLSMWRVTKLKSSEAAQRKVLLQNWLLFGLFAAIIGIPEILYYVRGSGAEGSFMRWGPGWTAGDQNLLWFWFKNTGLLLPLSIAGFFLPRQLRAKTLAAAGLVIFVIANLYLFAPWAWDNFKLLIFWFIFSLPLVGSVLAYIWKRPGFVGKTIVVVVVVLQCITGALDIIKTSLPSAQVWGEWDADARDIAQKVRAFVPVGQAVITAPYHNTPVALAGRPVYLGFTGHVWSHGGAPWVREKAVKEFYPGSLAVLPEYEPHYVLVGPVERQQFPGLVIQPHWQLLAQNSVYQLFKITP